MTAALGIPRAVRAALLLLALLLAQAAGSWGADWTLKSASYIEDSSRGTFVVNGSTLGFIVGIEYTVEITSGPLTVQHSGIVPITPQGSIPANGARNTAIRNHLVARGARNVVEAHLASLRTAAARAQRRALLDQTLNVTITEP